MPDDEKRAGALRRVPSGIEIGGGVAVIERGDELRAVGIAGDRGCDYRPCLARSRRGRTEDLVRSIVSPAPRSRNRARFLHPALIKRAVEIFQARARPGRFRMPEQEKQAHSGFFASIGIPRIHPLRFIHASLCNRVNRAMLLPLCRKELLPEDGYRCSPIILSAVHFLPTIRIGDAFRMAGKGFAPIRPSIVIRRRVQRILNDLTIE